MVADILDMIGAVMNISELDDLDSVNVKVVPQLTKTVMLVLSELVQMHVMQVQVSIWIQGVPFEYVQFVHM